MQLIIAGKDRTVDLGQNLTRRAARHPKPGGAMFGPGHSALALKQAGNREEFLIRYNTLIRLRHSIALGPFRIPAPPGWRGKVIASFKGLLWRLLRYQHDRIAFQQNLINELLIHALELQHATHKRQLTQMAARIEALEKARDGQTPPVNGPGAAP